MFRLCTVQVEIRRVVEMKQARAHMQAFTHAHGRSLGTDTKRGVLDYFGTDAKIAFAYNQVWLLCVASLPSPHPTWKTPLFPLHTPTKQERPKKKRRYSNRELAQERLFAVRTYVTRLQKILARSPQLTHLSLTTTPERLPLKAISLIREFEVEKCMILEW